MTKTEKRAWLSFVQVVGNFLGNKKSETLREIVHKLLTTYQLLGYTMSIKVQFFFYHLEQFPANLGDVNDERGERFHQNIMVLEECYQGRWDTHMMADYCWSLKRDVSYLNHSRRSQKRKFLPCL